MQTVKTTQSIYFTTTKLRYFTTASNCFTTVLNCFATVSDCFTPASHSFTTAYKYLKRVMCYLASFEHHPVQGTPTKTSHLWLHVPSEFRRVDKDSLNNCRKTKQLQHVSNFEKPNHYFITYYVFLMADEKALDDERFLVVI